MRTSSNQNIPCRKFGIHSDGRDAGIHHVVFDTLSHSVLKCPKGWDNFSQFISTCNGVVIYYMMDIRKSLLGTRGFTLIDVIVSRVGIPQVSNRIFIYNFGFGYDGLMMIIRL